MRIASLIDGFIRGVTGPALRDGTRYARESRVGSINGDTAAVRSVVRGLTGDYEVSLSALDGRIEGGCSCLSWRRPCKHVVALALVLRQALRRGERGEFVGRDDPGDPGAAPTVDADGRSEQAPDESARRDAAARQHAIEERVAAARREKLAVTLGPAPFIDVSSASGFRYRVQLRGGADGPHGCECPDFEANRLHTCKHVERARGWMRSRRRTKLPSAHVEGALRGRVYLHLGDTIEPRLSGEPKGRGARTVRAAFDAEGRPVRPFESDEAGLLRQLAAFGPFVEREALAWLRKRAARRPALPAVPFARLVPPVALEPYPFQWAGAEFLARAGRALLADEMGLGKTVQAILAALALRRADVPAAAVTIVCPASLRGGWQDEIARWTGERVVLLEGPAHERARIVAARPRWLITHYEQMLRDHARHRAAPPDLLIIDEAQRAKGLAARTARVLKAVEARYVFALTGTPLENRLEEAYAITQLIDQRLLPPLWQLDRDHFERDSKGRRVVAYRGLGRLRAQLEPAFLRRRKEDVALELPERVRATAFVPLHPKVQGTYDEKMMQVAQIASKKVILPADIDRMQRLLVIARRCCDGPHMLDLRVATREIPKFNELEQALRELCLGEGRKVVVFSEWTDMTEPVAALAERLGLRAFHLHGGVPVRQRPQLIRSFIEHDGPAVFVSTDAGGVGLNLQVADAVIILDLPWNPARLEQRIARVHRIGSRRTVRVLLLVAENTVEHRILALHETKRAVLANVWAKDGEDVIAAPGGSGVFRAMVQELLRASAPAGTEDSGDGSQQAGPDAASPSPVAARDASGQGSRGGGSQGGMPPQAAPTVPETIRPAVPAGQAPLDGIPSAARGAGSGPGAPRAGIPVDPATLEACIAGILPAVPEDHRRSLSAVFRALADALEGRPEAL